MAETIFGEMWTQVALAGLRKDLVGDLICNKQFKQQVWGKGESLNIVSVGTLTDKEYDESNITYEDITDSSLKLEIDKSRYVAFKSEDAARAKTSIEKLTEIVTDAGYQMGDYWDALVMAEYANAGLDSFSDGSSTAWQITASTAANIPALFGALKRQLKKANAPRGDIYFVAPPEIEEAITLYFGNKGPSSVMSDNYVQNANYMGRLFGVQTFISNNLVTGSSVTHGLAGVVGTSIALANDIITDEKLRLEGRIADGQRILSIGGIKTYRDAISIDVNLNETVIATS
jgi:hypothetical protein